MSRDIGLYVCPRGVFGVECRIGAEGVSVERAFQFPKAIATSADVAQHLAQCLDALGSRGARISVAIRGFGAVHHSVSLPPAPDDILTPIIEREVRRLEPELGEASIAWSVVAEESTAGEGPVERAYSVAAAPDGLLAALDHAVRSSGNTLEHVTVLPAAMERVAQEFVTEHDTAAIAVPLPDGLFIGLSVGGALRLAIEPPVVDDPDDVDALGEELELGAMLFKQQFHGATVGRIALVAGADRFTNAEHALAMRLGVPVERVVVGDLDAAGCAALGAVLDARSGAPLALAGIAHLQPATTGPLGLAATIGLALLLVVAGWSLVQGIRARDGAMALSAARTRIERESFSLTSARSTAAQRRLIRDARDAIHEIDGERLDLQRVLTRVSAATPASIQLDSLTADRAASGWSIHLTGRVAASTNAIAIQSLNDFYVDLPRRIDVAGLALQRLAYADTSADAAQPAIRFTLGFDIRRPSGAIR